MRLRARLAVPGLVALALLVAACVPPPPAEEPPPPPPPSPVTVETWVGGLAIPWDLAFTPDGTLLFTERSGGIKVVRPDRSVAALTGGVPSGFVSSGEGGMMGLAVDPAFGSNRRIYACFLSTQSGVYDVRVARFTVDAGFTALADRTDIVTGIPANPPSLGRHSGCRLRFGPDGALWVGTGDAAVGTNPQDLTSLGGKVLRVTTDGAAAAGNPALTDPRIHTFGHRNVQGLAFRPGSGTAYSVEHGTGCDDELNRLTSGGNYGWDPVSPGNAYDESRPMTDLTKFPTAVPAVWSSGCPTVATSGASFLTGGQWGDWDGRLAIAALKASQLRIVALNPAGDAVVSTVVTLTDRGRLRTPVQGPDGALYVTTSNGANDQILRVTRSA